MKRKTIRPAFVDFIPDRLEEGVLYICERYKTAAHKCCCGCGEEVITPLSPVDWSLRKEGVVVTLRPSIGNWSFACKSHYLISKNQVVWANGMSQWQIDRVQARDRADKKAYIEAVNLKKRKQTALISRIIRAWQSLVRWLKSL
jgi:hypothetical protein